ncbi:MAG TPA: hypothetical protein PLQ97_00310 [Myxococcota bacterium]|nr:hypothetical protein [Myxococcota bacterium]HQK49616.1 hypothetical protein [Myxococcota bacterium]
MNRQGAMGRHGHWGVLGILLVAIVTLGMGILHVARAKGEMALRREIWNEVRRSRALEEERARLRRQITELLAIPRTTVKAEVLGLGPVDRNQVLDLGQTEE